MKAIYQPKGKAAEYAEWACNFYVGCSNGCTYCYLKKGIGCKTLGGNVPTLKKCFKDEAHALEVFEKELKANLPELQKHGLFFSFTTDPLIVGTIHLTVMAVHICMLNSVPVKVLTKRADWIGGYRVWNDFIPFPALIKSEYKPMIAFGFTLTGYDELEPGASTNAERIEAMRQLHDAGFKTFASIEPIIDFPSALNMLHATYGFCDLYKIGLKSGDHWIKDQLTLFIDWINVDCHDQAKVYFKDSLLKAAGIDRIDLPINCVNRDFNIFQTTR